MSANRYLGDCFFCASEAKQARRDDTAPPVVNAADFLYNGTGVCRDRHLILPDPDDGPDRPPAPLRLPPAPAGFRVKGRG